jgi:hypothetical protein
MNLQPCTSCQRHVEVGVSACPFCGAAPRASRSTVRTMLGRVSRAAVFASAAACGSSTPHAGPPPPPPPPPDPVVVHKFATAPPPAEGKASVRGFVTLDGRPLTGLTVTARAQDGTTVQATTGSNGEYELVDLAPGSWTLSLPDDVYDPYRYSRRPQEGPLMVPADVVQLDVGENERHDIGLSTPLPPEPDRGPCCKPYGAPPARRRVV